jgi:hypothetical protein
MAHKFSFEMEENDELWRRYKFRSIVDFKGGDIAHVKIQIRAIH